MIDDDTFIEKYIKLKKQRWIIKYAWCPKMSIKTESYKWMINHD